MTLTQVALITRRTILTLIISSIVGFSTFIGYQIWRISYLKSLPPPEEKADLKFGLLPTPDFPEPKISSSNFSYSIDTATGGLPEFSKVIKVYFTPKGNVTFASNDKASGLAQKLGITGLPQIISDNIHQFREKDKSLIYYLDTGNFVYRKDATSSSYITLMEDDQLIANFRGLLLELGLRNEALRDSPYKIKLIKAIDNNLIPAQARQEASGASILLWPKDVNKMPIVTAKFTDSLIKGNSIGNFLSLNDLLDLKFTFWPIDETVFATYPLKSASQALEDLETSNGIVIVEPKLPQVSITSVYLAYFQSETYFSYLLPVVVFEGPSFVAYVNAIPEQYTNQSR